jgi:type IX secretion system PorP/SprF family membrane protein
MKRIIIILTIFLPSVAFAQQFPFIDGYNLNQFILNPAYAGIKNSNTLFMDYRTDLTGFEGGPTTYVLTYNSKLKTGDNGKSDSFLSHVGLGGKFVYDKADIFVQTLMLLTYTYEIKLSDDQKVNFGLSTGLYRNSVDLGKYYNDPKFVMDEVLSSGLEKSYLKFTTEIGVLYRFRKVEAGILFSNMMFGIVKYPNSDLTYKPFRNYVLHSSYLSTIDVRWTLRSTAIIRGGKNIPPQIELSPTLIWSNRFWASTFLRSSGIMGLGAGGEVYDGIILNYSFGIGTKVILNTFSSHQITLGVRIINPDKNKNPLEE